MTCHEARDQFSALVDDALAGGERTALEAHLATCPDCRRELQRFRDTIALVRAVGPLRAPAGFVDRVLEAARPVPWYRRLVRGLFLPWPVKLPIEAAAIVLVGIGVALVYRATPDAHRFTAVDSIAPPMRDAPATAVPHAEAPARERQLARETYGLREAPADTREPDRAEHLAQAFTKSREAKEEAKPSKGFAAPQQSAGRSEDLDAQKTGEGQEKLQARSAEKADAPRAEAERAPSAGTQYLQPPPTPAAPRSEADASAAKRAAPSIAGSAYAPPAGVAPPPVSGRLTVNDREAALRGVTELATRLGAVETRRADFAEGQLIELTVPREVYPEFVRELARLGRWQPSNEPAELPDRVRVVLQIAH